MRAAFAGVLALQPGCEVPGGCCMTLPAPPPPGCSAQNHTAVACISYLSLTPSHHAHPSRPTHPAQHTTHPTHTHTNNSTPHPENAAISKAIATKHPYKEWLAQSLRRLETLSPAAYRDAPVLDSATLLRLQVGEWGCGCDCCPYMYMLPRLSVCPWVGVCLSFGCPPSPARPRTNRPTAPTNYHTGCERHGC